MILEIFSIFDSKAAAFITPFFSPTKGTGIRSFKQAANDPTNMFTIHAGDYTLFHLGTFYIETGKITMLDTPENLGLAITHQQPDRDDQALLEVVKNT